MMQSYESLLCRFTPTGAGSPRPWYASLRGAHHFPSQPGKPQALARRSARYWRFHPSAPQRWLRADHYRRPAPRIARPSGRFSRCHPGRTRYTLECCPRQHDQPVDDWPCHPPAWTDAKKKSLIASERDAWQRAGFLVEQEDVEAADLVVIDEFGSNLDMTRRYARAPRGERAVASLPRNTPANTTTISSLTTRGMGPSLMIEGGVCSAMFEAYIEHILGPTLRPGQVILLDNLSAHKSVRLRELLAAAVAQALTHITPEDACAFFTHCGFRFRPNLAQWFCS